MRFRKLRIAWSVGWGVLTLLLITLWAISNVSVDLFALRVTQTTYFKFTSTSNEFAFGMDDKGFRKGTWHKQAPTDDWLQNYWGNHGSLWSAKPFFFTEGGLVFLPYWLGVLLSAAFTVAALSLEQKREQKRCLEPFLGSKPRKTLPPLLAFQFPPARASL